VSEILSPTKKDCTQKYLCASFRGKGSMPQTIYWDGKTESGALVESSDAVRIYARSTGFLWQCCRLSSPRRFETGCLGATLPATGLLVRVVNADLNEPATDRLAAVARLMEKYPKYKVKVEAHTGTAGRYRAESAAQ
jgi:hypothetical protein